jgi:AhpD family alkylhydroperoxidase
MTRRTKEAIALLVSCDNGCKYCVAAHSGALKMIGVSDNKIHNIIENFAATNFPASVKACFSLRAKPIRRQARSQTRFFNS